MERKIRTKGSEVQVKGNVPNVTVNSSDIYKYLGGKKY